MTVYNDHSSMQAILDTPNPTGKHVRWWTKVYGHGVKELKIKYRPGKANANADSLSHCSHASALGKGIAFQVAAIGTEDNSVGELTIHGLLQSDPISSQLTSFEEEQCKDSALVEVIHFLEEGVLPEDEALACKLALQEDLYYTLLSTTHCITWTPSEVIRSKW